VRVLIDGRNLADYQRYYLAATKFATARPDVVKDVVDALQRTGKWVKQSPREAAALPSPVWRLDAATIEQANAHRGYEVRAVVPEIADAFLAEGLLPKRANAITSFDRTQRLSFRRRSPHVCARSYGGNMRYLYFIHLPYMQPICVIAGRRAVHQWRRHATPNICSLGPNLGLPALTGGHFFISYLPFHVMRFCN
jgi:hypothetical protein